MQEWLNWDITNAAITLNVRNMKGRDVMGDKGGKKDKEKGQKQNVQKQKQKVKNKLDKQPKNKP